METKDWHFHRDELRDELLPLLVGRVFHVTRLGSLDQVLSAGEIRSNIDGQRPTLFGSTNSFFRKRGCVSVFDYRSASADQIDVSIGKCSPFNVPFSDNKLAFLFLSKVARDLLIPWTRWKEEQALSDKIVPYVEAGHPGAISMTSIEELFRVTISDPADPLVEALERGRARNAVRQTPIRQGRSQASWFWCCQDAEVSVSQDLYTKVVLTVIAICLIALTVRLGHLEPVARAQTSLKCTGELKANAWGGTEASIGGYKVDVTCN